jgi:hypothetical protein
MMTMMMITSVRRNGRVDVVIVLSEENIERIRRYDPMDINWDETPSDIRTRLPQTIGVAYATQEELTTIEKMSASDPDWKEKALAMLSRGFDSRADLGDYQSLEGTDQC